MTFDRTRDLLSFLALLALTTCLSLALGSAGAEASPSANCKRVHAKVSKRIVRQGGWIRVSGRTCSSREARPRRVRIKYRVGQAWRTAGVARTRRGGGFSKRVRVNLPGKRSATRVRVLGVRAKSRSIRVRLAKHQVVSTSGSDSGTGQSCALSNAGSTIGLTVPGCRSLGSDTASNPNPENFWGKIDCQADSRHAQRTSGGDTHVTADGSAQGDSAFRSLTVFDGDDIWGERCELGYNNHVDGPTAFYREGMRRATYASIRLPGNFPLLTSTWQTVLQMKQAQPSNNGGNGPIIELQANRGMWVLNNDWNELWTFPAQTGVWTRFVFDVTYSQDPSKGLIQVGADLNGDGDVEDAGERSPRFRVATLKRETAGGWEGDGIAAGESIPSHLRAGIYHNPSIPCILGVGCTTEIDNVQVLAPAA